MLATPSIGHDNPELVVLVIGREQHCGLALKDSIAAIDFAFGHIAHCSQNDTNLMEELAIAINLNLDLGEAKLSCIWACRKKHTKTFWLLFALTPIMRELNKIENLCNQSKEKEPSKDAKVSKIKFNPLNLTSSDTNINIKNPSMSTGSSMATKQGFSSEKDENKKES
ncbi:hypothetical protein Cgig2_021240 [Carnegiea gigantea]|uniref:Uncharacterized protein n=1 Tax=Carnegiea gigantea TaxID=171969 RepID=A0A9Q1KXM2_9CARY|nr:hypothetical protein Cgig2_021240 [Carnegiea gigantea]